MSTENNDPRAAVDGYQVNWTALQIYQSVSSMGIEFVNGKPATSMTNMEELISELKKNRQHLKTLLLRGNGE